MNRKRDADDEASSNGSERLAWTVDMLAKLGASLNEQVTILISLEVLMLFTSLSKAYIYQLMETDPTFPLKIKIGGRSCWSLWSAQRWIRAQIQRAESEHISKQDAAEQDRKHSPRSLTTSGTSCMKPAAACGKSTRSKPRT